MSATTLAPSAAASPFPRASGVRKVKNNLATVLVTLSFGVALVPLIWLLWTVIGKG